VGQTDADARRGILHGRWKVSAADIKAVYLVDYGIPNNPGKRIWFNLEPIPQLSEWAGKLVVEWRSERSWKLPDDRQLLSR